MKKIILLAGIISICVSCETKEDPFLIDTRQVGKLHKDITVQQLDSLYATDSLVKRIGEGDYVQAGEDKYLVYEKGGKHLLTLTPQQQHDSEEKIKSILIHDSRYKTAEGVTTKSTFKDIKENYTIKNIHNTFNNIVITTNGDANFTIDKKEIPEDLRYDMNLKIEAIQIPDAAKIKHFMIYWDHTQEELNTEKDAS